MSRFFNFASASRTTLFQYRCQSHVLPGLPRGVLYSLDLEMATFRLTYLVGRRVRRNWGRSNYKEGLIHHLTEEARVGGSLEYLLLLENTRLRAWRTDTPWIQLITSRYMSKM